MEHHTQATGDGKILNLFGVANMLGVSGNTVKNYVNGRGLPVISKGGKGKQWEFDKEDVLLWNYARTSPNEGKSEHIDEARARKMSADATLAEIEVSKRRKELVETKEVAKTLSEILANVRARIFNHPRKVAPMLQGVTELEDIQDILEKEVDEIMEELSSVG